MVMKWFRDTHTSSGDTERRHFQKQDFFSRKFFWAGTLHSISLPAPGNRRMQRGGGLWLQTNKIEILTTDLEGSTTALFRSCWFACHLTWSENTQDFRDSLLGKLENSDDGNTATGRLPIQKELVNDPLVPLLGKILSFV